MNIQEYDQVAAAAAGHDAPVSNRAGDFYDRWPTAMAISRVIRESPPEWSTRIGLFGRWGDGKTTVLNFLEMQQRAAGNIVIKFSPWGISTEAQVWKDFGAALIKGLGVNGIPLRFWDRVLQKIRPHGQTIASGTKTVGKLVQATGYAPGAQAGGEIASNFISSQLQISRSDVKRIINQLGQRRVVVFIDDLDRADPALVPKLLLALRELLDYARFAFVLAFDRNIVATSLQTYNAAWGNSGNDFLDKVIDFPFDLPAPPAAQIRRLAIAQFQMLCPFVPLDAIEGIVKLLPSNPRKLKLFARMIASTKEEASRHQVDELDWPLILTFALIRAESDAFANELLSLSVDTNELSWIKWAMRDNNDEEQAKQAQAIDSLIAKYPSLKDQTSRMTALAEGFRERCGSQPDQRLRYQAKFGLSPDTITWGEFKVFFIKWRKDKLLATTCAFIDERAMAMENERKEVEQELVDIIVNHHSTLLERAGEVADEAGHLELIKEAVDTLDLLRQCAVEQPKACDLDQSTLVALWGQMLTLFMQWRHFNANKEEPELRSKESDVLLEVAAAIDDPLMLFEKIKPWDTHEPLFDARSAALRNEFTAQIRAKLEPGAIEAALQFVKVPGQIRKLRSRDEHLGARFLLTAPESPCFVEPALSRLFSLLRDRDESPQAKGDALDWLDLFLTALDHGDMFCGADGRRTFLTQRADLVIALWTMAISAPSQFRFLESLRKRREKLVAAGIPAETVAEPDWLKIVV